jgi:hypothetical protein
MKLKIKKILSERFSPSGIATIGLAISLVSILLVLSVSTSSGHRQLGQVKNHFKKVSHVSPELYNSALAPAGELGGRIIPASCSIGEPTDAADGFAPCSNPVVTISPASPLVAATNGNVTWSYNSTNAALCDLTSEVAPAGAGPAYDISGGAIANTYSPGPFGNVAGGYAEYTVTCWNTARTQSGSNKMRVNTTASVITNLLFSNTDPFLSINSFNGFADDDTYGTLSWSVNGATSCSATGPAGWSGSTISLPTGSKFVSYTGTNPSRRYYTLTCTNGSETLSKTTSIYFIGSGGCFIAGTKVRMADGSLRDIETVLQGESIMTSNGPGTIEKVWHIPHKGNLYAFNGNGNYFVTDSHPFMTTEGWKSFNPERSRKENPGLEVSLLAIGDTLLKQDGSSVVLEKVDTKYAEEMVYNFKIDGAADFYADGYWVHNANIK